MADVMAITDAHMAALRALLRRDLDSYERLGPAATGSGFDSLLASAMVEAASRRFGRGGSSAAIVQFVADVRLRTAPDEVEPRAAERVVKAALGDTRAVDGLSDEVRASTQVPLLYQLIADEGLDDKGLDEFLNRARERAELAASAG